MIFCFTCRCSFTGCVRVGQPCSNCLEPLEDYAAVIGDMAAHYDAVAWVIGPVEASQRFCAMMAARDAALHP